MIRFTVSTIVLFAALSAGVQNVYAEKAAEAAVVQMDPGVNVLPEYTFPEGRFEEVADFEVDIALPDLESDDETAMELDNPYTLGADDVVSIKVMRHPEFEGDFIVGPDGNIQYTFVGDVKAAGLSKYELQAVLREKLRRYVKVPEVALSIVEYKSKSVYVMGEVARPGKYNLRGNTITLREAIIQSGLPTEVAKVKSVKIIRPVEGEDAIVQKVNMDDVLYKGNLGSNINLEAGDIVVVNPTSFHKVMNFLNRLLAPVRTVGSALYFID